jgi:hypothetical protein
MISRANLDLHVHYSAPSTVVQALQGQTSPRTEQDASEPRGDLVMARGAEGLTLVVEDLIPREVEASAGIALSNTHCLIHTLSVANVWPGANPPAPPVL